MATDFREWQTTLHLLNETWVKLPPEVKQPIDAAWALFDQSLQATKRKPMSSSPELLAIKGEIERIVYWLMQQRNDTRTPAERSSPGREENERPWEKKLPELNYGVQSIYELNVYLSWLYRNGVTYEDVIRLNLPAQAIDVLSKLYPEINDDKVPEMLKRVAIAAWNAR